MSTRQGDSNEYQQHLFLWRTIDIYPFTTTQYPPYLFYCEPVWQRYVTSDKLAID